MGFEASGEVHSVNTVPHRGFIANLLAADRISKERSTKNKQAMKTRYD